MNKREFKSQIVALLKTEVSKISWDEKVALVRQCIIAESEAVGHDESNKGKTWTDEELYLVLSLSPTKENCMKLARAFKRGYGSIEQIYRWAASSGDEVKEKRPDDAHIARIKRVAKDIGWRAT